jgi:hypothetical protein
VTLLVEVSKSVSNPDRHVKELLAGLSGGIQVKNSDGVNHLLSRFVVVDISDATSAPLTNQVTDLLRNAETIVSVTPQPEAEP